MENEQESIENWLFNDNLRTTYQRLSELGVPMGVADRYLVKHIASANVSKNPDKSLDSMTKDVIASGSIFTDNYCNHSDYNYIGPNPDYYNFIQTNNSN
jgi:hypothetical protein